MKRSELQRIAMERIQDAKVLLEGGRWSAAYYLAGYSIECALKACIIVHFTRTDAFPERRFSEQCWSHNLSQLLGLSGLAAEFDAHTAADAGFLVNWGVVKDWTEPGRYERRTKAQAQEIFEAITDKKHGVFPWFKSRWNPKS